MTPTTPDLSELIRRLEGAMGDFAHTAERRVVAEAVIFALADRDRDVSRLAFSALGGDVAAIGAAIALVERQLPGCDWGVGRDGSDGPYYARIFPGQSPPARPSCCDSASTPALAVLIALMKCREARDDH